MYRRKEPGKYDDEDFPLLAVEANMGMLLAEFSHTQNLLWSPNKEIHLNGIWSHI